MRHFIGSLLTALALATQPALATEPQRSPVVVELFTSQGCSACPPADALLHELAKRPDIIALSLHVDYWDYIGWKDSFGDSAFTARQKDYARAMNSRAIYTPQIIINGRTALVGHDAMKIVMAIDAAEERPARAAIEILSKDTETGKVRLRLVPLSKSVPESAVQLVRYIPDARVDIRSGENAGRSLSYANVVNDWTRIGTWKGNEAEIELTLTGSEPAVLIVQALERKDILAGARLN